MLLRKPRSYAEVYNDVDGDAVNLFRVLRDQDAAEELKRALQLTPFAREEFNASYEASGDMVERARRLVVRSFMGFGSNSHGSAANGHRSTGFRSLSSRSGTTPAHDWMNYPDALDATISRMRGVVVESRDALEVMAKHDGAETLHYVDPPYIHSTRAPAEKGGLKKRMYAKEMTDDDHSDLLDFICNLSGMVVLSGYAHDLYDRALAGWERKEKATFADGARPRTEVLWLNKHCVEKLTSEARQLDILEAAE